MHFTDKFLFIVYYTLYLDKPRFYKSFICSVDKSEAKNIFLVKIRRDLKNIDVRNIRCIKMNKSKYKGSSISDKEWEYLKKVSYPNKSHKMQRFHKDSWFKKKTYKNRNSNGTFKTGNVPWNKDFKILITKKNSKGRFVQARDSLGRFKKGNQPILIGSKNEKS